ncbi:MAG TPA: sulfatase-like hydrolase/transferase, partial [Polyangiales bacterium]|nr:sulfatase-like hydrolase/transferase [Polyangiales bacterium]
MAARRPSLVLATPLVLLIACGLDLLALPRASAFGASAPIALVALAIALGALQGALWEIGFALLSRAPRWLAACVWLALFAAPAAWLCGELGAFARLGTPYHRFAVWTLIACGVAAPSLAAVLFALQPNAVHPLGWLPGSRLRVRALGATLLVLAAGAAFFADRRLFVGLYPSAHLALRACSVWLPSFALVSVVRLPPEAVQRPLARAMQRALWLVPWAAALATLGIATPAKSALEVLALGSWPRLVIETGRQLTDFDGDGYSGWLAGGDCAPFDPRVHPAAPEIAGNGRDDNCLLGDAPRRTASARAPSPALPSGPAPFDLVLITIDSLRADRIGGYAPECGPRGLDTTPQLDAWARDALLFEHAYTAGGWTSIALSSLMRGVYPRRLEWTRMFEARNYKLVPQSELARSGDGAASTMFPLPIGDRRPTLGGWLSRRGMHTIAVVDDGFSELLSSAARLAPGFRVYRKVDALPKPRRGDRGTVELALSELAAVPAGQRFFLWVHFFGPHTPNTKHPGVRLDGKTLEQGYEHEVRFLDQQLGQLLNALAARAQPPAVFVSADHGEEFIAGGRHHGWSLRDDVLNIPLLARVPGWPRGRSRLPASLVDMLPTLCELSGTPCPAELDGRALGPLLASP